MGLSRADLLCFSLGQHYETVSSEQRQHTLPRSHKLYPTQQNPSLAALTQQQSFFTAHYYADTIYNSLRYLHSIFSNLVAACDRPTNLRIQSLSELKLLTSDMDSIFLMILKSREHLSLHTDLENV
ncbi:hypothetical protein Tcan_10566 [Toxocara canis]|uniref:Uncharacterized protein n=1 Tax=Toxocara canis TaxID=6265 RepID=A0A0B2UXF3_TOXCA|nr:hypothetical protein Tcan_10566 [Toxocara canis]